MLRAFEEEWRLYQSKQVAPSRPVQAPLRGTFDGKPQVGEIRIFADSSNALTALILADSGSFGYRVIPVSPFTVPASRRERLVGTRVFQLWNTCTLAKSFVERSWIVDTLEEEDRDELAQAVNAAKPGRVSLGSGIQAEYEKAFLLVGGARKLLAKPRKALFTLSRAMKIAACLLILTGAAHLFIMPSPEHQPLCESPRGEPTPPALRQSKAMTKNVDDVAEGCIMAFNSGGGTHSSCAAEVAPSAAECMPSAAEDAPITVNPELGDCPWAKGHKLLRIRVETRNSAKVGAPLVAFNPEEVKSYHLVGPKDTKIVLYEITPGKRWGKTGTFCTIKLNWRPREGGKSIWKEYSYRVQDIPLRSILH